MLIEKLQKVLGDLQQLQSDIEKADHGNKAAARRIRVALQETKKEIQDIRLSSFKVNNGEGTETVEG